VAGGLEAHLQVHPGDATSLAELDSLLQRAGVVFGIDPLCRARLAASLPDPTYRTPDLRIALGTAPTAGEDGQFIPAFELEIAPYADLDGGYIDLWDRVLLKPIDPGTRIATYTPATSGAAGRSVLGSAIAAKDGVERLPTLGEGVALLDDGSLVATRQGALQYTAGKSLDVVQHYLHNGDVDAHSGNLDMEGAITVNGSVMNAFHVHATGDVFIKGMLEGGTVRSLGSVSVARSVHTARGVAIQAEGDITVHRALSATLLCRGRLEVKREAVLCTLTASEIVVPGHLVGGTATAQRSITVQTAGTAAGTKMTLIAAVPLAAQTDSALARLNEFKRQRHTRAMTRTNGPSKTLAAGKSRHSLVRPPVSVTLLASQQRELEALQAEAFIAITSVIHPGVTLRIGTASLTIEATHRAARFRFDPDTKTLIAEEQ